MGIGVQIMYGIPGCTTIPSYQWTQVFWRHMLHPFSNLIFDWPCIISIYNKENNQL